MVLVHVHCLNSAPIQVCGLTEPMTAIETTLLELLLLAIITRSDVYHRSTKNRKAKLWVFVQGLPFVSLEKRKPITLNLAPPQYCQFSVRT
jgi:hypothetical protein